MLSGLFRRKNRNSRASGAPEVGYQIECACGHTLAGKRGDEAIQVKCPKCRAATLVFPTSPLTDLRETIREGLRHASTQPKPPAPTTTTAMWRKPLLAAAVALVVIIVVFVLVLTDPFRKDSQKKEQPPAERSVAESIAAARQAITEWNYRKAAERFRSARAILQKQSDNSDGALERWLAQMETESLAVADQIELSLEEILQKASGVSDRAWKEQFAQRYADRTVIFDALVRDVGSGSYRIDYPFTVGGLPVYIEVPNAAMLSALKIQWPARCLIAVRLGDARRERGTWLVLARPDGAVLFTDPAIFLPSTVAVDADLTEQLKKQAAWLNVTPP